MKSNLAYLRSIFIPIALGLAIIILATQLHGHYPIQEWLIWRYAFYWLLCAFWSAACVSCGHRILQSLLPDRSFGDGHLVMSFAVGLLIFFLGMFFGGLLGWYGSMFFIGLPAAMVALGGWSYFSYLPSLPRRIVYLVGQSQPIWAYPVAAFGFLGILMVYFPILSPYNIAYDAAWYHLPIAEHYVAQGGIKAFPEGWFMGAYPPLASLIYCWAFQLPIGRLFDRIELSAHLEFTIFLWTLAGLPVLVRWLVPKVRIRLTWVALFLFPGIFLYDSSLTTAADHIAAFWGIPIFLALSRALFTLQPSYYLLLAMMLSGALLTKYQSLYFLAGAVLAIIAKAIITLYRRDQKGVSWWSGPLMTLITGLFLTAPHWLKNWLWYGDPLYPHLYKYLPVRPWAPDSTALFESHYHDPFWMPKGTFFEKITETIQSLISFSFQRHENSIIHRDLPVFGFLFTLLLLVLPFLKKTRRIWGLLLCTYLGLFLWYWLYHQDRYLQLLVPWMAAGTTAIIILVWRLNLLSKSLLAALILFQVVWGSDVYFFPVRWIREQSSITKVVMDLISSGFLKDYENRFATFPEFDDIGRTLPRDAKVLVHEFHLHVGLRAMSATDSSHSQGGIRYSLLKSPAEISKVYRDYGVTHILWETLNSRGWDSLGGDLMFFNFVSKYAANSKQFGGLTLAQLNPAVTDEGFNDKVLLLGCGDSYESGLYQVSDLRVQPLIYSKRDVYPKPSIKLLEPSLEELSVLLQDMGFMVIDRSCHDPLPAEHIQDFTHVASRQQVELWVRAQSRSK